VRGGINARNLKPRSPEGDLHRRSGEKSLTVGSSRREDCNFGSFDCREKWDVSLHKLPKSEVPKRKSRRGGAG
jgi:hypothetical protein